MDKLGTIDEIVSEYITNSDYDASDAMEDIIQVLDEQEPHYYNKITEIIHCKDCKYYEPDVWGNISGMQFIIAHDACNKWGNGYKTEPEGYCHMAERGNE